MMKTMAKRQRGISFSGFLVVLVLLILGLIGGMKLLPAYIEDASIKSAFNAIVNDPEMRGAKISDVRMSFSKRAIVSNITAITAEDIEIVQDAGGISLSASYTVRKPLIANISLLIDFTPHSASK